MIPSLDDVIAARKRVAPHVHRTPVLTSQLLNQLAGASLYFKCENFQKMGAFKMRGAINAILSLSEQQRSQGVVTHSSGNFGQAVALAAKNLGVPAYIVMPSNAPQVKKDAVQAYQGQVTECEPTLAAREAESKAIMEAKGATFLHPSNDIPVILGNATAAAELLEDQPELDVVLSPIGGGGLVAGTALSAAYYGRNCTTIGGEPKQVDDAYRSLMSGQIQTNERTATIADGLRTQLGDQNFPIIQKYVQRIIRVEEDEIVNAMRLIWERLKIVIEPSSAVPFAAVLKEKEKFSGHQVGIIISGGNIDVTNLPFA